MKLTDGFKSSTSKFQKFKNLGRSETYNNMKEAKLQKINKKMATFKQQNQKLGSGGKLETYEDGGMIQDGINSTNYLKYKSNKLIDKLLM